MTTSIDNNAIVCWFESAIADDTHTLETLLATHPTLLERIHEVSDRSALQLAAAWDASRAVAVLLEYVALHLVYHVHACVHARITSTASE